MTRLDVGEGLNLNYVEEGQGDPLLIVAGPGSDLASNQLDNLKAFAKFGFCAITSDTRGGGESDWTDWYSYKACADDAANLLAALNIDKAVIYGGSNGGIQALYFAVYHPDRTRAIIVDGSSSEVNHIAAKNWRNLALKTIEAGRDVMAEASGPGAVEGGEFKIRSTQKVERKKEPDPKAQFAMLYGISELYENPLTPRLRDVTCPALILIGEQDKLVGVGGSVKMSRALPNALLKILPESGHTVLGTTPEIAQKEISEFMKGLKN
jgi:pimeloyl-ACP methyl ester carboxylesterase